MEFISIMIEKNKTLLLNNFVGFMVIRKFQKNNLYLRTKSDYVT